MLPGISILGDRSKGFEIPTPRNAWFYSAKKKVCDIEKETERERVFVCVWV